MAPIEATVAATQKTMVESAADQEQAPFVCRIGSIDVVIGSADQVAVGIQAHPHQGGDVVDDAAKVHCHQCRQKVKDYSACKNMKNKRLCMVKICGRCLWNRYSEKKEEVDTVEGWACPKCRGICNCSVCMKKRGQQPTGKSGKAKAAVTASDMMIDPIADPSNQEGVGVTEQVGSSVGNASVEQGPLETLVLNQEGIVGTEPVHLHGFELPSKEFGNVLQLVEFCSTFETVLDITKADVEHVLRDIFHGTTTQASTVEFHIKLLTFIESEGERQPWFDALKRCLSEHASNASVVTFLETAPEYDALNASQKLEVLNLLCYVILGTQKLRNWMDDEHKQFHQKIKAMPLKKKINLRAPCMRAVPVFIGNNGHIYWKLNSYSESEMLHQYVGTGEILPENEKFVALSDVEKEAIEKLIERRG